MSRFKGFSQIPKLELLIQAKQKRPEAQRQLYLHYADACFTTAYRLSNDNSLAADICHEAFLVVFEKLNSFLGQPEQFNGWLKRIVVNKTINRMKFENRFNDLEEEPFNSPNNLFTDQWLNSSIDLNRLLEQLPAQQRSVLWLYEIEGYSHAEIGLIFNKSVSFSKVTLMRAYCTLRTFSEVKND